MDTIPNEILTIILNKACTGYLMLIRLRLVDKTWKQILSELIHYRVKKELSAIVNDEHGITISKLITGKDTKLAKRINMLELVYPPTRNKLRSMKTKKKNGHLRYKLNDAIGSLPFGYDQKKLLYSFLDKFTIKQSTTQSETIFSSSRVDGWNLPAWTVHVQPGCMFINNSSGSCCIYIKSRGEYHTHNPQEFDMFTAAYGLKGLDIRVFTCFLDRVPVRIVEQERGKLQEVD